jgi:hypothetical protein
MSMMPAAIYFIQSIFTIHLFITIIIIIIITAITISAIL